MTVEQKDKQPQESTIPQAPVENTVTKMPENLNAKPEVKLGYQSKFARKFQIETPYKKKENKDEIKN